MATQKKALVSSGVALLSAATVVAAAPALAPNLNPSPAFSSASYQLAAFADVLRITPNDLVNTYYQGWGGAVGGSSDTAQIEPMASACAGGCYVNGLAGVAYLIEDALINGNGLGPAYVQGGPGIPPWKVSAVNYFYESNQVGYGVSGGIQYLVQTGVAQGNPALSALITLAFGGPTIVSVVYTAALTLVATAVSAVPLVGPIIAGGINSYLNGYPPDSPVVQQGIPGLLAYVGNLLTGGIPLATTPSSAATTAPAPAAAGRTAAETAVAPLLSAARTAVSGVTGGLGARTAAPVTAAAASAVAPVTETDSPAAPTESASDGTAQPESPATVAPVAPEAKAAPAPRSARGPAPANRPVRDAMEKVTKQVRSALSGLSAG